MAELQKYPVRVKVVPDFFDLAFPRAVERYEPWQRKRFAVPQGMTSWWVISGRSDKPLHLHIEDDVLHPELLALAGSADSLEDHWPGAQRERSILA